MRLVVIVAVCLLAAVSEAAVTPMDMAKRMGVGTNLGNTLDAPHEGDWASKAQEYFFDDWKAAGFQTVRIPVQWNSYIGNSSPYTIQSSYLDRVETVVGWCLSKGFVCIINSHHDDWLDDSSQFSNKLPRFKALWTQVAQKFASKSEDLVFEIFNEPHKMTVDQLNQMNHAIVPIIRQSNPTRIIILGGLSYMNPYWISGHWDSMQIPIDSYLMIEVHSYDPYAFAGFNPTSSSWGSSSDQAEVANIAGKLYAWAKQHGMAVLWGEIGVTHSQSNTSARKLWYQVHREQIIGHYGAVCVWDDDGGYLVYHRTLRTFDNDVMQALGLQVSTNSTK